MAKCKLCGLWAGIWRDEHEDCAKAVSEGRPPGINSYSRVATNPDRMPEAQAFAGQTWLSERYKKAFDVSSALDFFGRCVQITSICCGDSHCNLRTEQVR